MAGRQLSARRWIPVRAAVRVLRAIGRAPFLLSGVGVGEGVGGRGWGGGASRLATDVAAAQRWPGVGVVVGGGAGVGGGCRWQCRQHVFLFVVFWFCLFFSPPRSCSS